MNTFEWAHATAGERLIDPDELDELAPDLNEAREWGLWMGDAVMIYGSLDDLKDLAARIDALVLAQQGGDRVVMQREIQHVLWVAGFLPRAGAVPLGWRDAAIEPGSFVQALIRAIFRADDNNRARLAQGFPGYVWAVGLYERSPESALAAARFVDDAPGADR